MADSENPKRLENDEIPSSLWDFFCHKISKSLEEGNFYEAADMTRNLVHQVNFECKRGSLSYDCKLMLKEKCLNKYASLIDDPCGINNYATEIETLVVAPNPQSAEWKSGFDNLNDSDLLALLPEDSAKPAEHDVIIKCGNGSIVKEDKEYVVNSLCFLNDIHISEEKIISNGFSENDVWKKISTIVTNCEHLWKEKFEEDNSESCIAKSSDVVLNKPQSEHNKNANQEINIKFKASTSDFNSSRAPSTKKEICPESDSNIPTSVKRQKMSFDSGVTSSKTQPNLSELQFQTAKQMMILSNSKQQPNSSGGTNKCLGLRRAPNSKFIAPLLNTSSKNEKAEVSKLSTEITDERLKNIDPKMVEIMLNEIMDQSSPLTWDEIAGLEFVKKTLKEIVVWPILRPDIFTGLRGPPKGILLFGPPGTGKTLIGKCVASQSKSTFFSISASSLSSKWVGEGEKLVRALFAVARCYQPAVIFIDEIDSLLIQRSNTEHEASRRIKTEFLVQFDGVKTLSEERLLIIGATNRPHELDEAARRRLVKRLYIPLPEAKARKQIVVSLLASHNHQLSEEDLDIICSKTDGYSGADMTNLCKEAALGPIRSINFDEIAFISNDQVRPIILDDFIEALKQVRASVSQCDLGIYEEWNKKYGSGCSL